MAKPLLIVIVGPTAVGKTAIAITLAKRLSSVILSADSRQFFKETSIGTAKPSEEQLLVVPHHFVNNLSIHDSYSVGDFERDVMDFLEEYFKTNPIAFLVGGSGLYIDAVIKGFDNVPQVPDELRQTIMKEVEESGLGFLCEELKQNDPAYYETVDLQNTQRVVRAIEVMRHTGQPFSSFWNQEKEQRPFDVLMIGITNDRDALYTQINLRVDQMMAEGLEKEARNLHVNKHLNALQTVGYKELFDHFNGLYDLPTAVELIKRNTRRFAKRQLTWFRRNTNIHWFQNTELDKLSSFLETEIGSRSST